jgi:hypothetical protein
VELRVLGKHKLKYILNVVIPLLCHPSLWIRQSKFNKVVLNILGVAGLFSCVSSVLPDVDVHFIVYPIIRKFLKFDINEINVENLEEAAQSPISREIYETAVSSLSALDSSDSNKFSLNVMVKAANEGSDIDK